MSGAQGLAARACAIQEAQDAALRDVREPIDPEVLDPNFESGPVWSALRDDPDLCIKLTRFPPRALRSLARACLDVSVPPRGRAPQLSVFDGVSLLMTFLSTGIPISTIATIYRLKEDPVRTAIERARSLLHRVLCTRHLQRVDRIRPHSVELPADVAALPADVGLLSHIGLAVDTTVLRIPNPTASGEFEAAKRRWNGHKHCYADKLLLGVLAAPQGSPPYAVAWGDVELGSVADISITAVLWQHFSGFSSDAPRRTPRGLWA